MYMDMCMCICMYSCKVMHMHMCMCMCTYHSYHASSGEGALLSSGQAFTGHPRFTVVDANVRNL